MTTALLHAHRCMLKDVPVPVPIPMNTIPDLIVPSHIIVPRCSGNICAKSLLIKETNMNNTQGQSHTEIKCQLLLGYASPCSNLTFKMYSNTFTYFSSKQNRDVQSLFKGLNKVDYV